MAHQKIVMDIAAGTSEYQPFTAEEEADHAARERAVSRTEAALERRAALLAECAPNPALRQKIERGEAPTSDELLQCVRWLVLKDAPTQAEPTQTEQDERELIREFDAEDDDDGC